MQTFNLIPGALRGKQYVDSKYKIFEVYSVWSGYPDGGVNRVDLLDVEERILYKVKFENFKKRLTAGLLIQI